MNAELSWDEFRLVKAISDSGSLGGAADILGLNHSTVFRRLAALETTVGVRLFERSRDGYRPTSAGEEMIALATTMADSIVEFERRIAGRDVKPTGQLRVTTLESVGQHLLPAIMAQFQAQTPGVVIDLILSESGSQSVPPGRRRRHPGDQRSAGNAGRTSASALSGGRSIIDATLSPRSDPSNRRLSSALARTSGRRRRGGGSRRMSTRDGSPPRSIRRSTCANSQFTDSGRRSCPASSATPAPP